VFECERTECTQCERGARALPCEPREFWALGSAYVLQVGSFSWLWQWSLVLARTLLLDTRKGDLQVSLWFVGSFLSALSWVSFFSVCSRNLAVACLSLPSRGSLS
jgi:hypothetical protein